MRERYYPPAYDRAAELLTRLELESTSAAVYLEGTAEGVGMVLFGMNLGFHAMIACGIQLEEEYDNLTAAQAYAEEAINVHPGWAAPGTKALQAYSHMAEGFNALGAERARAAEAHEDYLEMSGEMQEKARVVLVLYNMITEKLNLAHSAVAYWSEAGEQNQRIIGLRSVETLVIDLGKANIANAKEQLQSPAAESTTDAENPTPASATAKLRAAKDALAPLAKRVQDVRTRIGTMFTAYEEAGQILMNWNPERDGPEPEGLRDKHSLMGLLIQETNLVLTAQEAELHAATVSGSYEAVDTVTAVTAEAQRMREQAAGHLTSSDDAAETYIQRGYNV
jgi:hypothetical protein